MCVHVWEGMYCEEVFDWGCGVVVVEVWVYGCGCECVFMWM